MTGPSPSGNRWEPTPDAPYEPTLDGWHRVVPASDQPSDAAAATEPRVPTAPARARRRSARIGALVGAAALVVGGAAAGAGIVSSLGGGATGDDGTTSSVPGPVRPGNDDAATLTRGEDD